MQDGNSVGYGQQSMQNLDFLSQLQGGACQATTGASSGASFQRSPDLERQYVGDQRGRDEYIRQLETENRYMRSMLAQYMGLNSGSSTTPPVGGQASALSTGGGYFRGQEGMPMVSSETGGSEAVVAQLPYSTCAPLPQSMSATLDGASPAVPSSAGVEGLSQGPGLSPSAVPFVPTCQAWQETCDRADGWRDPSQGVGATA